jgi:hypothetical protein
MEDGEKESSKEIEGATNRGIRKRKRQKGGGKVRETKTYR